MTSGLLGRRANSTTAIYQESWHQPGDTPPRSRTARTSSPAALIPAEPHPTSFSSDHCLTIDRHRRRPWLSAGVLTVWAGGSPGVAEQGVERAGFVDHRGVHGAGKRHQAGVEAQGQGAAFGLKGAQVPGGGEPGRGREYRRIVTADGDHRREPGGSQPGQVDRSVTGPRLAPPGIGSRPVRLGEGGSRGGDIPGRVLAGEQRLQRDEEVTW